jgi:hypothetical protein
LETEEGLCQDIVKLKYLKGSLMCLVQGRINDSPVLKDLMKIRHLSEREGGEFELNDGKLISFWLDPWLDNKPICIEYPIVYELSLNQKCFVHEVAIADWVVQFKIRLPPMLREQWYNLVAKLNRVSLNDAKDRER